MLSITIPGKPIPLKRHRHTKNGGSYNPQRKEMDYYAFMAKILIRGKTFLPFEDPIKVEFIFHMPIPKRSIHIKEGDPHFKRVDIDNLCKFSLDALNGIIWRDDALICGLSALKIYSKKPRTEISITAV